ncbi:MAG: peptide deformylase [Puniceicoccales bacterium]|jgi:peptide deformylase|nr:peptide deformylase [Puniceicoccales bacterium]
MDTGKVSRIVKIGDPDADILYKEGREVTEFGKSIIDFAKDLIATMRAARGIGIAAQQVGRSERALVIDVSKGVDKSTTCKSDNKIVRIRNISPIIMFNAKVENHSKETRVGIEGCLSVPGQEGEVERYISVEISYQDENGKSHRLACNGLLSICSQHEIDHNNGIVYTKKAIKVSRKV